MHQVILSLAANCNHEKNLSEARSRLEQILSSITFSRELWTNPIGSHCILPDKYLNQLVRGCTQLPVDELSKWLKDTEIQMGRTPEDRQLGIVRIDIDLLEYDGQRYHLRDWERSYVKELL